MSPAAVSVRIKGLEKLQRRLDAAGRKHLSDALRKATGTSVLLVEAEAKERVPQVTRALFRSIGGTVTARGAGFRGVVKAGGEGVAYARAVEFGTKPHVIRPKRGRVLRWRSGRGFRYATKVNHPGTRAQPYMEPTLRAKRPQIQRLFSDAANDVLRRVAR